MCSRSSTCRGTVDPRPPWPGCWRSSSSPTSASSCSCCSAAASCPRGRRRKQEEINQYILDGTEGMEDVKRDPPWPEWLEPIVELNRNLGAMPLVGGNNAQLLPDYEKSLARDDACRVAQPRRPCTSSSTSSRSTTRRPRSSTRSTTPLTRGRGRAGAARPHRRDPLGRQPQDHPAPEEDGSAKWHYMLPVRPWRWQWQRPDLRNHRKLLVVDGEVAFTGSQNFIDSELQQEGQHPSRAALERPHGALRGADRRRNRRAVRDRLVRGDRRTAAARSGRFRDR